MHENFQMDWTEVHCQIINSQEEFNEWEENVSSDLYETPTKPRYEHFNKAYPKNYPFVLMWGLIDRGCSCTCQFYYTYYDFVEDGKKLERIMWNDEADFGYVY